MSFEWNSYIVCLQSSVLSSVLVEFDNGVIRVQSALYGRKNNKTCSEGRPPREFSNTGCSQNGTGDFVKNRCNGKKVCEISTNDVISPDPCYGTYKYLQTNFTCVPASMFAKYRN
uniref:SUEL-type lectin domain-containing protein n=1 Tax=Oryzias latipes TaxID=8090 RepID=A0A3B3HRU2_ORYLA